MRTHETKHIGVTIDVPFAQAYAFTSRPENFPKWAAGLADTLRHTDRGWVAVTPAGDARVRFSEPNGFGILDHTVHLPDGSEVFVPMRLMPNGDGTELVLTLYRQPGMDDAAYAHDAGLVTADLQRLKALLEEEGDSAP